MKRLPILIALVAIAFVASSSVSIAAGPTPHGKASKVRDCSSLSKPTSVVVSADSANPEAPVKIKTGKYLSDDKGACRPLEITIQPTNKVPKGVTEGSDAPQSSGDSVMMAYSVRSNVCDYTAYGDIGLGMWVIAARVRQDYHYETIYGLLSGWTTPQLWSWIPKAGNAFGWKVMYQSKPKVSVIQWVKWYTHQGPLKLASPIIVTYAQQVQVGDVSLELNTTHLALTVKSGPAWHCAWPVSIW